jgi:nucleoid-associated protein YgaU
MFVRLLVVAVLALGLWALFARDSGASGPEQSYRVRAGDTLWSIAASHLAGDPRKGIWELQRRNHLGGTTITPGHMLRIP